MKGSLANSLSVLYLIVLMLSQMPFIKGGNFVHCLSSENFLYLYLCVLLLLLKL